MRRIDRYLWAEWLKSFAICLAAVMGLLLLENIQNELQDFLSWKAPLLGLLQFYVFYLTGLLPLVLPVAFLLSVLFTLGNLHRNHETTALKACGLSPFSITRVLWLTGACLTAGLTYLNLEDVPLATERTKRLRETWRTAHEARTLTADEAGVIAPMGFDNRYDRRLWMFNRFSTYTNEGFGVTVFIRDAKGRETARLMATEGHFEELSQHWVFTGGRYLTFDVESGSPVSQVKFDKRVETTWQEPPSLMLGLHQKTARLSLLEIRRLLAYIDTDHPKARSLQIRHLRILMQPIDLLVVLALAIPFALSGVRKNPVIGLLKAGLTVACYYGVSTVMILLGERGVLPTEAAVASSPALFLLGGVIALSRLR